MSRRVSHDEDAIESAAATWLARRDAGLDRAEEAELERWKMSDPRHAAAMAEFESMWTEIGRPRRTGGAVAVRRAYSTLRRRRYRRQAGIAAAAFAFVLSISLFIPRWLPKETAPAPARAIVLLPERRPLPDGSLVELKGGAEIAVNFDAGTIGPRRITLKTGEAHFQVAKDELRPFVVTVGKFEVRAVGTAFSIQLGRRQVEVFVTEGSVAVEKFRTADDQGQKSEVSPETEDKGQTSVVRSPSPVVRSAPSEWVVEAGNVIVVEIAANAFAPQVLPVPAIELNERLAWRSPRVEFSRASLPEVVTVVNRYSGVQFRIADAELNRVTLSGLFRADDAEAFARALERSFGIDADRISESEIVLTRAR